MRRTLRRQFFFTALFGAALPAVLAITLLYYLLGLHDALVMGHLKEISQNREAIMGSYKDLVTGKKHRFTAQSTLLGQELARTTGDPAAFGQRATRLLQENPEIARIALYPQGSFDELETSTRLETPKASPLFLKERAAHFAPKTRYVSHVRWAPPYELQVVMATSERDLNSFKTLGKLYAGNSKIINIFKGIRKYYWYLFFAVLALIVLFTFTISSWILKRVAHKIKQMTFATQQVAQGDLQVEVPVEGPDDLSTLATNFNLMVHEIKETRRRIHYLERMGAWQEVARNLAHEIKNPLTPILLAVQQIQEKAPRDDPRFLKLVNTASELVKEEVATLRRLVDTFGNLARLPDKRVEPILVERALADLLELAKLTWPECPFSMALNIPKETTVMGDRMLLKRALLNILENAIDAMEDEGTPPQLSLTCDLGTRWLRIVIKDQGPGFPDLERIFDPYYTTKEKGTGLGLPLARKIFLDIGGDLMAENGKEGGASIVALLPVAPPASSSEMGRS